MNYLTEYKSLLRLGSPVLVTQLSIILVSFIDTAMVGAYGVGELASSAFVNSVFMIPIVMLIGFAQGSTPLVGALYGRGESEEIGRTLRSGLSVNTLLALVFTAVMGGIYFLLDHFGQPEELLPIMRPYYLTILASMVPMGVFCVCQQTANGVTDTGSPMWVMLGANVVNVIGNYLLIFGKFGCPELGLTGAGISTLVSRIGSAVVMLLIFASQRRYHTYWLAARHASNLGRYRRKMWKTSLPVMIQSGLEVVMWSVGAVVCGWYGKIQLASYQIVNTIAQLGFMTFISFGTATSIRVSNYTGRGDRAGVRRIAVAGLHLNLMLALIACVIFLFWGGQLAHIFTSDSMVIEGALALIPPLILYQFGDAAQLTYANALRGTSDVVPLMIVAITAYIVVGIPLLLLLGVTMGLHNVGIYYSFSVALLTAAVMLYIYFRRAVKKIPDSAGNLYL